MKPKTGGHKPMQTRISELLAGFFPFWKKLPIQSISTPRFQKQSWKPLKTHWASQSINKKFC